MKTRKEKKTFLSNEFWSARLKMSVANNFRFGFFWISDDSVPETIVIPRNLRACLKCFQDSRSFRMKFFRGKICHHNHSRTRVFFFHRHLVILDGCGTNGDFKAWFQGVKCMKWIFLCSTCDTKIIQNLVGNIHLHVSPTQTLYTMG